jgi:serine/threonine protein kinase
MWSRDFSPGGSMASLTVGQRLGAYEIIGPLGAGGMGEVFRARDSRLDRQVAVKVLPASIADSPDALARFEREARAVAAHPRHSRLRAVTAGDVCGDGAARRRDATRAFVDWSAAAA